MVDRHHQHRSNVRIPLCDVRATLAMEIAYHSRCNWKYILRGENIREFCVKFLFNENSFFSNENVYRKIHGFVLGKKRLSHSNHIVYWGDFQRDGEEMPVKLANTFSCTMLYRKSTKHMAFTRTIAHEMIFFFSCWQFSWFFYYFRWLFSKYIKGNRGRKCRDIFLFCKLNYLF